MNEKAYVELKNAWIAQLYTEWRRANYVYFENRMCQPEIDLSSSKSTLGSWTGGRTRRLCISTSLIETQKWQYTQEVLCHEMVHQYIEEVLNVTSAPPHGELFKKICSMHSIDPRAGGPLEDWLKKPPEARDPEQRRLNKVQKLFSLAQSSNQHEAELAMTRARELMLRHNLSLKDSNPDYIHRQIGAPGQKSAIKSLVAGILSQFFFVKTLWTFGYDPAKNQEGRILEIFGRKENTDIAEYVYTYLLDVVERLWKNHKTEQGIKGDRNRRTFIYGVLHGFHEKLEKENETTSREKGLVWQKDALLLNFFEKKRPMVRNSPIKCNSACSDTYESGLSTGKRIVLNKGVSSEKHGTKLIGSVT